MGQTQAKIPLSYKSKKATRRGSMSVTDETSSMSSGDNESAFSGSVCQSTASWKQQIYTMGHTKGDGTYQSMEDFYGKVIYAVNVASKWGLTKKEYKKFVELDKKYGDQLVIIGFPTREYAFQEYKTDEAIAEFAKSKNFPGIMMQLGKIKGNKAPELWQHLREETGAKNPKWNFQGKFLVSKTGDISHTNDKDIDADIERLVNEEFQEDEEYKEFIEAVTGVWR